MTPMQSAAFVALVSCFVTIIELVTGAESLPDALGRGILFYLLALVVGAFAAWAACATAGRD